MKNVLPTNIHSFASTSLGFNQRFALKLSKFAFQLAAFYLHANSQASRASERTSEPRRERGCVLQTKKDPLGALLASCKAAYLHAEITRANGLDPGKLPS